jgi:hypothetical protein
MEETLLHLTRALEQHVDKEARAASLEMAMANLQSMVVVHSAGSSNDGVMEGMENSHETTNTNLNELSKGSEDFVKESFASSVEIVKHSFKNAVAAVHNALEFDELEETDYLGRRLLTYYDCHKQGQESGTQTSSDVDLYATTQESLVAILNGLLGDKAPSQEDILNLVSVFMAFPANFAIEFVKFMLAWKLHHTTCLKSSESTALMEATLFVDYMGRVEKEQRAEKKAEEAAAATAAAETTDVAATAAEKETAVAAMMAKRVEAAAAAKEAKMAEVELKKAEIAEKKAAAVAKKAKAAAEKAEAAAAGLR